MSLVCFGLLVVTEPCSLTHPIFSAFRNGVYWGVYNVVERPDQQFAAIYFGGDDDDWFYANHGGVGQADPTRWNYLTGALADKNMAINANYAEMQQYLDVRSFADYMLAAFYVGLTDWPANNCKFRCKIAGVVVSDLFTLINQSHSFFHQQGMFIYAWILRHWDLPRHSSVHGMENGVSMYAKAVAVVPPSLHFSPAALIPVRLSSKFSAPCARAPTFCHSCLLAWTSTLHLEEH